MIRRLPLFLILPMLASCVAPSGGPVAPTATPSPRPAPAPSIPATPVMVDRYSGDWSVAELTPGEWRYARSAAGSSANFTTAVYPALVSISCHSGQIRLTRVGMMPADMLNIRTSAAERSLPMQVSMVDRSPSATLDARDPLWDQISYSRGRFLIEATRQAPLIVPARPEIVRVVEDCRG